MHRIPHRRLRTLLLIVVAAGCARRNPGGQDQDASCDPSAPECDAGLVCEAILNSDPRCVGPVLIRGTIIDLADEAPISDARVQAVDVNGAAVGTSSVSAEDGTFELTVPALRDEDGVPLEGSFTLRAQAAGYQEFPTAIRPALPLDPATALSEEDAFVIENSLTTVGLIALPGDTSSLGSIAGTVLAAEPAGVLVVAANQAGAYVGFSDSEGAYIIFNVTAGTFAVQGYRAGLQLTTASAGIAAAEKADDVDLSEVDRPLSAVSGNVQIVNAPGGSVTSVVLAVESTFVEAAARGAVPPGLRIGDVTGAFTLMGVPDGRYVVLAAFENDGLVRDPDQNIGGTQIVHIEVPDPAAGNAVVLPEGFKVTGALAVVRPGADQPEQVVSPTPVFEWADDSSEDGYEIRVFDAFGVEVWNDELGPTTGSAAVTHTYGGPALIPGMFYQFRATSFRERSGERTHISATEDLRGVFYFLAP